MADQTNVFQLTSTAFENKADIPARFTCDGENINPEFKIHNVPEGTQGFALVMEDPDTSKGTFDHWIVWNIESKTTIAENSNPGISGKNGSGKTGYHGPCPPSGNHRYFFYLFALDQTITLEPGADKEALLSAIKDHTLAKATLMGRYAKSKS